MTALERLSSVLGVAALSKQVSPVSWESLQPVSLKNQTGHRLFTLQRLKSASGSLQAGRIVGLTLSEEQDHVTVMAYIHSALAGSRWYLVRLQLLKETPWTSATFKCPCVAGKSVFCHHVVSLLLIINLLQTLPTHRPQWFKPLGSMPSKHSKNTTQSFKDRYKGSPIYIKSPLKLLYLWGLPYPSRADLTKDPTKQTFQFDQKTKKSPNLPRGKFKTQSWRIASSLLERVEPSVASAPGSSSTSGQPIGASEPSTRSRAPRICRQCGRHLKGHKRGSCEQRGTEVDINSSTSLNDEGALAADVGENIEPSPISSAQAETVVASSRSTVRRSREHQDQPNPTTQRATRLRARRS